MLTLDYSRKVLKLPMTPLIDVVFILLLFFMLSSTFIRYQQFRFESAPSGTTSQADKSKQVSLIVAPDGQLETEGRRYSPLDPALPALFQSWLQQEKQITVTARSNTSVQTLITTLDQLHEAGLRRLSLSESY